MKNTITILLLLLTLALTSCNKDLGNYDYHDINEVIIKIEENYAVRKSDTVFVIRPDIIQSIAKDTTNLSFSWYINTSSDQIKGTLASTRDTIGIKINSKASPFYYTHYMRFYVTDKITGAQYMYPVKLKIVKPYEGSWMVLHENKQGKALLGAIEYIGDNIEVTPDVYKKESGKEFTGRPVRLGYATYFMAYLAPAYMPTCLFFCYTDNPEESGVFKVDAKFEQYDNPSRFIYPQHLPLFNPADISSCRGEGRGRLMVSGGNLFQGSLYDTKMYAAKPDPTVGNEFNITAGACIGWTSIAFDSKKNRFIHFYNSNAASANRNDFNEPSENAAKFGTIRRSDLSVQGVDPNNIPKDQKLVYLGPGYWYGPSMRAATARLAGYGLTVSESANRIYFYEFHGYSLYSPDDPTQPDPPFAFYNSIENKMGITESTPFSSTNAYNRLLFYGKNNSVYRLDVGTEKGTTTAIYTHPNPEAKVTAIKVARDQSNGMSDYNSIYSNYGHNLYRSFAVIYEMPDGTGEVVILNLNASGRRESVQEIKGFNKITDITFV